jgi:hypothetical protein
LSFATKGRVELHRRLQGAPPSKQKLYRRPGSGELSLNSPLGKFCLDGIEEVMIEDRRVFTLVDLATIGDLANIEAVLSTRLARCRSWKMTITRLTMIAGAFLDAKRNAIFIGGTGTDKTHLCIGVASAVICARPRGRFFNTAPFSPGHHPDSAAGAGSGRHEQTIGERLIADQAVLRALPELAPIEHSGWP